MSSYEKILVDLIHDLRQPLGNMEITAWCLDRAADPRSARVQEYMQRMREQLDQAESLLAAASADVENVRAARMDPTPAYQYATAGSH